MNPVVIFIAVAFWGWMWGIVGAIIAVPILIALKVFAEHVEGLHPLGQFLAARHHSTPAEPAALADGARAGAT
jgi:predicted PurR-regulated permease PerM